ncbi:MAG: hypothetical protein E7I00_08055 [Varibaculum cambriense]|nr:hypothetical protein [Varibaculum cambriense]
MINYDELDQAFQGSGRSIFSKDTPPGTTITGTITDAAMKQVTKFGSTEPDYFQSGDPKMQIILTLKTDLHDDVDDDGTRAAYIKLWGSQKAALAKAIETAGCAKASQILVPGTIFKATFHGKESRSSKNGSFTENVYSYQLQKGAPVGIDQAITQQAAPAVPVTQTAPAAPVEQATPAQQAIQAAQQANQNAGSGELANLQAVTPLIQAGLTNEAIQDVPTFTHLSAATLNQLREGKTPEQIINEPPF